MPQTSPVDAVAALAVAISAVKSVGDLVREHFGTLRAAAATSNASTPPEDLVDSKVAFKQGAVDIVTQIDREVETRLAKALCAVGTPFESFNILGEEQHAASGAAKGSVAGYNLTDEPTWVVDPVDGTTNFVHGFPVLAVSVALVVNGESIVAVVYNPVAEELFEASKGGGARLNGRPLRRGEGAGEPTGLPQAIVSTNVGYDRSPEGTAFTTAHLQGLLSASVRSIRMGGAAANDICYVAAGRTDAFYEWGIHPWDIAAATLILTEAGGHVCDPQSGDPLNLCGRRVVAAANPSIARELVDVLSKTPAPLDWAARQN